ncbi:hypothetical protein FHW84_002822 [Dyella sp. SG562]|uniref:hypothetical protein n=1 Tax=Dyella sp. SG562 TaxID=2587017 RepID=UPI001422A71F|nr:hypothetical protein [Dyella sp. SG562]NII74237.1 hypothetical protein [Dyella sp. SG562]
MSITTLNEATAVNTLLRFLLVSIDLWGNRVAPTSEEAKEAAAILAKGAHDKLCAGINEHQVREAWDISELSFRRPGT